MNSAVRFLWIFLLILAPSLAHASKSNAKKEACVIKLESIVQDSEILIKNFPEKWTLPSSVAQTRALFVQAMTRYEKELPLSEIDRVVRLAVAGDLDSLVEDDFKVLKQARKRGQIVKTSFKFYSKDNVIPKEFNGFLRNLGKFNDLLEKFFDKPSHRHEFKVKFAKVGTALIEDLEAENYFLAGKLPKLGSIAEIQDFVQRQLEKIHKLNEMPTLDLEEYHDLRKKIRSFAIVFQRRDELWPDIELRNTGELLHRIDRELGSTKNKIYGVASKNSEVRFLLPAQTKNLISIFLSRHP